MSCLPRVLLYILDGSKEDMSSRLPSVSSYISTQLNATVLTRQAILGYIQHATANLASYIYSFNSERQESAMAITPAIQHGIGWCTDYFKLKNIGTWTDTSNGPAQNFKNETLSAWQSNKLPKHSSCY